MKKERFQMGENVRHLHEETTAVGDSIRQVGHRLDSWGERTGHATDKFIHSTNEYREELVNYVKRHPIGSALVVGGALGVIAGWFLLRR
jgi:ElaB/YqjD/DUF883 family membrane-anchored ribosome-binding protein